MAWVDNRAWSHPKVVNLSDPAFRAWVSGICYSSGFFTNGVLTKAQQKIVGASPKIRGELVGAGLWIEDGDAVVIHDWDEHNGVRDEKERKRKEKDAERKRLERQSTKCPPDSPADSPADSSPDESVDVHMDVQTVTVDGLTVEKKDQLLFLPRQVWTGRKGLIKHRDSYFDKPQVLAAWKAALKVYDEDSVIRAIENYASVLESPQHFFSYSWTFVDFLKRGLDKFVGEADPWGNFRVKDAPTASKGATVESILGRLDGRKEIAA